MTHGNGIAKWISTGAAAKLTGLNIRTIQRYVEFGWLRSRRLPSGRIQIEKGADGVIFENLTPPREKKMRQTRQTRQTRH